MRRYWYYIIVSCDASVLTGCGKEGDSISENPDPPVDVPDKLDGPDKPENPNALYNGIVLPDRWPPTRSYSSGTRSGMSPFYLASKPEVVSVSTGRQLFVDNSLIESTSLKRVFHYPEYSSTNPIFQPDKDWGEMGSKGAAFAAPFSGDIWYDEADSECKMWCMVGGGTHSINDAGVTCYAGSADEINWMKPVLSVMSGTSAVDKGSERDASAVWLDKQESNASERFKMFQVAGGKGNWKYHYKTSIDGKQWRGNSTPSQAIANHSTVYKDPFRNVWVWSMRHNVCVDSSDPYTVRARDCYEDTDPATGSQRAKANLKAFWSDPWRNERKHPAYNNDNGSPGIYNLDATPHENIMLGFFSVWWGPENDVCSQNNVIKRSQIMMGYGHDGYSWYREDTNPFIAVDDNHAAWNNENLQSVVGAPLVVGDKLYFCLSGCRLDGTNEIISTGLATLRRDGFASMKGTSELLTSKLRFTGEHFYVNAKMTGELRVELLRADGTVIPGFAKVDCKLVTADGVKQRVGWKGNATLASLKGQVIEARFYITDGKIYSLWVSPNTTDGSQGYTTDEDPGSDKSGLDIDE